jgi:hypothetical protein
MSHASTSCSRLKILPFKVNYDFELMPQKSKVALDFVVLLELNVQVQLLKVQKVQC